MIIYASYRTDIPAFYGEWFYNRAKEGYLLVRNPMNPHTVSKIKLDKSVDVIVFCSKNYEPFLPYIKWFNEHFRCYFNYTINAYDSDIEPYVPSCIRSIETVNKMIELGVRPQQIAWRYDPILFTEKYDMKYHESALDYLTTLLHNKVDRCIFSFVSTIYPNVKKNIPDLITPTNDQIDTLLWHIEDIVNSFGLIFQTCGHGSSWIDKHSKIRQSGCNTVDIFENTFNIKLDIKSGAKRTGCSCITGKDIGIYNSCKHACSYCYAARPSYVNSIYDTNSPLLLGKVDASQDRVIEIKQQSNIIINNQLELF